MSNIVYHLFTNSAINDFANTVSLSNNLFGLHNASLIVTDSPKRLPHEIVSQSYQSYYASSKQIQTIPIQFVVTLSPSISVMPFLAPISIHHYYQYNTRKHQLNNNHITIKYLKYFNFIFL